jgi:hypothetical protein
MNRQAGGIIYELRCCINGEWYPFYVGRTNDQRRRLNEHITSTRVGTTLVYQFIREQLEPVGVAWDLFPVETYSDDYVDQEDEHIMTLLCQGVRLKNMKKGDATWMTRRIREAEDMVQRGISSYRKYREIVSLEQQTQQAEARHNMWIETDPRRQQATDIMAAVRQTVNQKATERFEKQQAKQARAQRQEQAVKTARKQQQEQWERDGYSNNFVALFEKDKK